MPHAPSASTPGGASEHPRLRSWLVQYATTLLPEVHYHLDLLEAEGAQAARRRAEQLAAANCERVVSVCEDGPVDPFRQIPQRSTARSEDAGGAHHER